MYNCVEIPPQKEIKQMAVHERTESLQVKKIALLLFFTPVPAHSSVQNWKQNIITQPWSLQKSLPFKKIRLL